MSVEAKKKGSEALTLVVTEAASSEMPEVVVTNGELVRISTRGRQSIINFAAAALRGPDGTIFARLAIPENKRRGTRIKGVLQKLASEEFLDAWEGDDRQKIVFALGGALPQANNGVRAVDPVRLGANLWRRVYRGKPQVRFVEFDPLATPEELIQD